MDFIPFPRVLVLCDKQSVSSRIWTRVTVSISYDNNHYTTGINHIISECIKLAQKEYEVRHDWVGKVIHWEMCKKFKFYHANKWYRHNPAPALENGTHKLLWDFNIQTDHQISARWPDLIIISKTKELAKLSTLLSWLTTV